MKIKSLLIGMLACSAMVACTNEDSLENEKNSALKGNSYLSVNLSMGNPTSRATQNESFDNGTADEAAVLDKNVVFLFYDASGNYVTEGSIQYYNSNTGLSSPTSTGSNLVWDDQEGGSNVERKAAPVIVLGPTKTVPAKVIAVLNDNELAAKCKGQNMSATLALTGNTTNYLTEAGYVMSNSAYVKDNNVVYATDIAPEQICESAADAIANPVNIYVERVAAKVVMSYSTNLQTTDNTFTLQSNAAGGKYMVDDEVATLKVKVAGWKINAFNETSSLIKKISAITYFDGWNNANYYRSYWAEDVNYNGVTKVAEDATPEPWEHTGESFKGLKYLTWAEADCAGNNQSFNGEVSYLNENTTNQPVIRPNDKTNATTLLVVGYILVNNESTAKTLFTYKGGYYTETKYKNILMGALSEFKKTVNGESQDLVAGDFVWTEVKKEGQTSQYYKCEKVDYQTVVLTPALAEGVVLAENKTIADIHAVLAGFETKLYDGGRCYYQIPIKHIYDNEDNDSDVCGEYGIVRNHSYQLTLNSITNIGGAIFDPENEVLDHIPGEEDDYYIAATLNVLAWRVVANQDVEL